MYSGSNSYLGGSNSARPGQPQYGQQQQQPFQQPGGFQGGLGPQPTGFGQAPLQQQFTGFPGQPQGFGQQPPPQQQPQQTGFGFPGQQGQSYQQQAPQQVPFQTGAPPSAPPQMPQPTGMTSSQIADSFRGSASQSLPPPPPAKSSKIPNIRLSFITAQDQAKFEQLFKSAVGNAQALSGDQARDLLMRSKLPGDALSHIWYEDRYYQQFVANMRQDPVRHDQIRPASFPRVRACHVPVQSQADGQGPAQLSAGEGQE